MLPMPFYKFYEAVGIYIQHDISIITAFVHFVKQVLLGELQRDCARLKIHEKISIFCF